MKRLRYAFRMTHIDNIPHILRFGLLTPNSANCDKNYISIGDSNVIEKRKDRIVSGVKLGECVPFYLGPRSPMLYVIQNGYNGVKKCPPQKIVYCVLCLSDVIKSDIDCVFTDGHALSYLTRYYQKEKLTDIDNIIDVDDVYALQWNANEVDNDKKRRKEAELLIKDDVPPKYIRGFVVYDKEAKEKLISLDVEVQKIVVKPNYYF